MNPATKTEMQHSMAISPALMRSAERSPNPVEESAMHGVATKKGTRHTPTLSGPVPLRWAAIREMDAPVCGGARREQ